VQRREGSETLGDALDDDLGHDWLPVCLSRRRPEKRKRLSGRRS
jgi:hypothetical protein